MRTRDGSSPALGSPLRRVQLAIIVLPAAVVFGAEVLRHEVFRGSVPGMAGNVATALVALGVSAGVLLPLYRRLEAAEARARAAAVERAVLAERLRIARDLHDTVAQALFFLGVKAAALGQALEFGEIGSARQSALEIQGAVRDTSDRVRNAIFDLRTGPDPDQPFAAWVRSYAHRFGDAHDLEVSVEEQGLPASLPLDIALRAAAVVREALHNVAKHAQARSVSVLVEWTRGELVLRVSDDGRGVPDPIPGGGEGRYGLALLDEQVRAVGGTVQLTPRPGGGAVLTSHLPLSPVAKGTDAWSAAPP